MTYISIIERQGIEKGIEQGIEQGIEKGIGKGRSTTLQKLLQLKFGDLPSQYQQRLEQAQEDELDLWTERVLFADSLEAIFTA